ncbi:MAG: insulinase family protein [Opitutaceae bacterium]|nr:insulinase family protein [Opitutaceae bacterium]
MKTLRLLLPLAALALSTAHAGIADYIVRDDINGIDLLSLKTGVKEVVTIKGTLPLGNAASPADNPALALLTGSMLDKGTTTHDKFALAQALDNVGATLSFGVGTETLAINGKCLAKDSPLVISLLAEQLRSPAFSPEEFAKVQKQYVGALKQALDNTNTQAADNFSRAIYPLGHPNRKTATTEMIAAVERTTLDEVKAFYAEYYGPAHLTLVLVGDVDSAAAKADVAKSFAGWTGGKLPPAAAVAGSPVDAANEQTVFMADKTNVSVVWGQATGLRYNDPDALALRVGTDVLGGGFSARLMGNVRDKEGLTYGIYGFMANDNLRDGDWRIMANFAPALLDQGIASTRRQLVKWHDEGVTASELAARISGLSGEYKVGLSTTDGMAGAILSTLQRGYQLSWLDEYPAALSALTLDQVNAVIKKHLDPAKMVIIKAGTVPTTPGN